MQHYLTKHLGKLICLVLITVTVGGCGGGNPAKNNTAAVSDSALSVQPESATSEFNAVCDELFKHMILSDSITLNYSVSNPSAYGITEPPATLGEYSEESVLGENIYYENILNRLNGIDKKRLPEKEALTYDIIYKTLSMYAGNNDYMLYEEPLSPVSGVQAKLPVLLAEYHFYNTGAIEKYFNIINCIPDYINNIIEFEKKKKDAGLFMSDSQADEIIKQCMDFIYSPDNNYLIKIFRDNISSVEGITGEQIKNYCAQNKKLVTEILIPSYKTLIDALSGLKEGNSVSKGLCSLPHGKEYYSALVHSQTCSEKSVEEIYSLIESTLASCQKNMARIVANNPKVYDKISSPAFAESEPEAIMQYLINNTGNLFPVPEGNYAIKYVHPSLEDTLSPAMYITPPVDCASTDSIYINRASAGDSSIFPTLAHEGYPGHMCQMRTFMATSPHPVRLILDFGGYCEGWATYAELMSYDISGLDDDVAELLKNNKLALLCIYCLIDVGVHYYEWDINDVSGLLADNGITDAADIEEIYSAVLSEPALYLKYTLSCLEFTDMKNRAEKALGNKFNIYKFHEFILTTGPAWFDILNDRLDIWIKKCLSDT